MSRFLFLIILIVGLFFGIYLVTQRTYFTPKAGLEVAPQEIKVTNVSDNSFTVSWITAKEVNGFISYGSTPELGTAVSDDRDVAGRKDRLTHHVTLTKLSPDAIYYFKIGSGPEVYGRDGKPYEQKTAPTTQETPPLPETVFGNVVKTDKNTSEESLIYLQVGNNTPLSTYIRDGGKWLLTINNSRTADLGSYLQLKDSDVIDLFVEGGSFGTSKKQLAARERIEAVNFVLDGPKTIAFYEQEKPQGDLGGDLNGDGKVNAFDFAITLKKLILK